MEQAKKNPDLALPEVIEKPKLATRGFFWFVAKGNTLKGPFSTTELKKLIQEKQISLKLYGWKDGFKEWRPLYGVEEFSAMQKDESEAPQYPLVPVPGAQRTDASGAPASSSLNKIPVFRVQFTRSRLGELNKIEIVSIFSLTLLFAFLIILYSFNSFEKQWDQLWGRKVSGMLLKVGAQENAMPIDLIKPILSAPGLQYQDEHFVAIEVTGAVDRANPALINQIEIKSGLPTSELIDGMEWDKTNTFTRQVRVQGLLDLKNPGSIYVENKGLPFEPLLSERRAHP